MFLAVKAVDKLVLRSRLTCGRDATIGRAAVLSLDVIFVAFGAVAIARGIAKEAAVLLAHHRIQLICVVFHGCLCLFGRRIVEKNEKCLVTVCGGRRCLASFFLSSPLFRLS